MAYIPDTAVTVTSNSWSYNQLPAADTTYDFGSDLLRWRYGYFNYLYLSHLYNAAGTIITDSTIRPDADGAYNLGGSSSSFRWANGYFSGTLYSGGVVCSSLSPSSTSISSGLIVPSTTGAIDFGSTSKAWRDFYQTDNTDVTYYAKHTVSALSGNRTYTYPNADANLIQGLGSATSHNVVQYVGTDGTQHLVQLATTDLSDGTNLAFNNTGNSWSAAQIPATSGATDIGSTAKAWKDIYQTDSTDITYYLKHTVTALTANRTHTIPNADCNPIQPLGSATANNWVQYIGSDGTQHLARPAFTDISGSVSLTTQVSGTLPIANGGTNNNALGVSALGIYTADGTKMTQVTGTASQQFRVNAAGTAIEAFTPTSGSIQFTVYSKSANFTASDGAGSFYRMTGSITATLPAAAGTGNVLKFQSLTGTITYAFNGTDKVRHEDGTLDASLTQDYTSGVIELMDVVSGEWVIT